MIKFINPFLHACLKFRSGLRFLVRDILAQREDQPPVEEDKSAQSASEKMTSLYTDEYMALFALRDPRFCDRRLEYVLDPDVDRRKLRVEDFEKPKWQRLIRRMELPLSFDDPIIRRIIWVGVLIGVYTYTSVLRAVDLTPGAGGGG